MHTGVARVPEATVLGWIGDGVRRLVEQAVQAAGREVDLAEVMPVFMVHYCECMLRSPRLFDGVAGHYLLEAADVRDERFASVGPAGGIHVHTIFCPRLREQGAALLLVDTLAVDGNWRYLVAGRTAGAVAAVEEELVERLELN